MHMQSMISDLAWHQAGMSHRADQVAPSLAGDPAIDAVVSGAVLVACAFRMRDEAGLIAALRTLAGAVDRLEAEGEGADAAP